MLSFRRSTASTHRINADGTMRPPISADESAPLLPSLWSGLERAGVAYCLLRGSDRLDKPSGDVDLLVAPDDIERFHDIAGFVGFALERRWGQDSQHHLLGLDGSHPVALHVVTEVGFGPPGYPWLLPDGAKAILERRTTGHEPVTAAPADEFWLSLHHCLLDKGRVAPHHQSGLQRLVEHIAPIGDDRPVDPLSAHLGARLREDILTAVAAGRWPDLEAMRGRVRRRLRHGQHVSGRVRSVARSAELTLRKVGERHTRRGVSVALMGPDGAGKSSLTDALSDALPMETARVYLGLYPTAARARGVSGLPGLSFLSRIGRLWWAWLGARRQQARRRVVIMDRHPADARLSTATRGRADTFRRWLLGRCLPLPDVVLVLDAPADVLHHRSGEHTPALLDAQRTQYLALARRLPQATVIQTNQSADAVCAAALGVVWRAHLDRHRASGRRQGHPPGPPR